MFIGSMRAPVLDMTSPLFFTDVIVLFTDTWAVAIFVLSGTDHSLNRDTMTYSIRYRYMIQQSPFHNTFIKPDINIFPYM